MHFYWSCRRMCKMCSSMPWSCLDALILMCRLVFCLKEAWLLNGIPELGYVRGIPELVCSIHIHIHIHMHIHIHIHMRIHIAHFIQQPNMWSSMQQFSMGNYEFSWKLRFKCYWDRTSLGSCS